MDSLNLSDELQIHKHRQGISLVKPGQNDFEFHKDTNHTVGSLLNLPFSIYFISNKYTITKTNEATAELCGFDSPFSAIGLTAFDFADRASAEFAQQGDKQVMVHQRPSYFEHKLQLVEGNSFNQLTVKVPWYENERVIGLMGFSIALEKHSLLTGISNLLQMGLLNHLNDKSVSTFDNTLGNLLTNREQALLPYITHGKTAREIADLLFLSRRTVERHIENIKEKLHCNSKSDLISKAIQIYQR